METSIHNNKKSQQARPDFIKRILNWAPQKQAVLIIAMLPVLNACSPEPSSQHEPTPLPSTQITPQEPSNLESSSQQESARAIVELFNQTFNSTLAESEKLKNIAVDFYTTPTNEKLSAVKTQWITTHQTYTQLSVIFNLMDASEDLFYELASFKTVLDAQPILPGYLDRFGVYTDSGIVNDLLVSINAETIRGQHQATDPEEISLGLHAIEFLLWGAEENRTIKDFMVTENTDLKPNQIPQNRRRDLIRLQTQLLHDDLTALQLFWQKNTSVRLKNLEPISQLTLWNSALKTYWQTEILNNINDNNTLSLNHEFFASKTNSDITTVIITSSLDFYLELFAKQRQFTQEGTSTEIETPIITKLQLFKTAIENKTQNTGFQEETLITQSESETTEKISTSEPSEPEVTTAENSSSLEEIKSESELLILATEIFDLLSV